MARQNVARPQSANCFDEARARIGQRDSENGEIDRANVRLAEGAPVCRPNRCKYVFHSLRSETRAVRHKPNRKRAAAHQAVSDRRKMERRLEKRDRALQAEHEFSMGQARRTSPAVTPSVLAMGTPAAIAISMAVFDAIKRAPVFCMMTRDIEKMIDVSVRNEDGICARRQMRHRIINALPIWLNRIRKKHLRHSDPGKIGIDEQDVTTDFKLVAVRAQISDPHASPQKRFANYRPPPTARNPESRRAAGERLATKTRALE